MPVWEENVIAYGVKVEWVASVESAGQG